MATLCCFREGLPSAAKRLVRCRAEGRSEGRNESRVNRNVGFVAVPMRVRLTATVRR